MITLRYRTVGGLRFLRIARFQFSWCMVRRARVVLVLRPEWLVGEG